MQWVSIPQISTQVIKNESIDYNIIEDMKRARANISIFELTKITRKWYLIIQALSLHSSIGKEVYASQFMSSNSCDIIESVVNVINLNSNTLPPIYFSILNI